MTNQLINNLIIETFEAICKDLLSMHYCLKVAELQNQILNNLPNATAARNLVVTCHALSELTLDILWYQSQYDLVLLLWILLLKSNIHIVSKTVSLISFTGQ